MMRTHVRSCYDVAVAEIDNNTHRESMHTDEWNENQNKIRKGKNEFIEKKKRNTEKRKYS